MLVQTMHRMIRRGKDEDCEQDQHYADGTADCQDFIEDQCADQDPDDRFCRTEHGGFHRSAADDAKLEQRGRDDHRDHAEPAIRDPDLQRQVKDLDRKRSRSKAIAIILVLAVLVGATLLPERFRE